MNTVSFDAVSNAAGRAGRRGALRALAALGAGALGTLGVAAPAGTKKNGKKRKRKSAPPPPVPPQPAPPTPVLPQPAPVQPVIRFGPRPTTEEHCVESLAECEPGERAVGGGYELGVDSVSPITFLGSNPSPLEDGATPTQWFAGVCTAAASFKNIQAYAVCVPG
jgi:hypothetical protein